MEENSSSCDKKRTCVFSAVVVDRIDLGTISGSQLQLRKFARDEKGGRERAKKGGEKAKRQEEREPSSPMMPANLHASRLGPTGRDIDSQVASRGESLTIRFITGDHLLAEISIDAAAEPAMMEARPGPRFLRDLH